MNKSNQKDMPKENLKPSSDTEIVVEGENGEILERRKFNVLPGGDENPSAPGEKAPLETIDGGGANKGNEFKGVVGTEMSTEEYEAALRRQRHQELLEKARHELAMKQKEKIEKTIDEGKKEAQG